MALVLRLVKGEELTHEEMDNNLQYLEDLLTQGGTVSKTVTLEVGDNVVTHGSSKKARIASFFTEDGEPVNFYWKRDPDNPNTKIIVNVPEETPARDYTNLEINILCK